MRSRSLTDPESCATDVLGSERPRTSDQSAERRMKDLGERRWHNLFPTTWRRQRSARYPATSRVATMGPSCRNAPILGGVSARKAIVGLAVYYKLGLSGFNPPAIAIQALEELRRGIEGLGVLELTKVLTYTGQDCGPDGSGAWSNPGEFLKTCAWGHLDDPSAPHELISIDPLELMGFVAWIGSR